MSTSWYRSNVISKLVWASQHHSRRRVELWETTCIVTNFSAARCSVLINPANPNLSGVSKFSYFPKGGPEPKELPSKDAHHIMGYVTSWGGMEVGNGMMFSANVVDGLVHQLGGWRLAYELKPFGSIREGQAVLSGAGSEELKEQFLQIIHTVPPFYNQTENNLLRDCYEECFNIAESLENVHLINQEDGIRIACPLLGAGCRGFPVEEAIHLAAKSVSEWSKLEHASSKQITIAFGIPSGEIRKQFQHSLTSY